ncbi:hypothetical protein ICG_04531 [Bacillus cereus BAG1X1-3]|nr:hypothetical protein ICG_04531 [Bacillus cereus BAG1X1-3]EOO80251.1 hypothetical protein IC7_00232 [Bacillus cereus BAG1O-1]
MESLWSIRTIPRESKYPCQIITGVFFIRISVMAIVLMFHITKKNFWKRKINADNLT